MNSMQIVGRFLNNFREFYNEINTATLTGAIDVIVVEQPDGSYSCSPFHVRFGKLGVLRSREKVVDIEVNNELLQDIHMKLGDSGEAFFVEEIDGSGSDGDTWPIPEHLATSPIPVSEFENIYISQQNRRRSFDLGHDNNDVSVENQVNSYAKRRNTADSEHNPKSRERDFVQRQIGLLGNVVLGEEGVGCSKEGEDDGGVFKMDALENEYKSVVSPITQSKIDDPLETRGSKKKRRKTRKKNTSRKPSNAMAAAGGAPATSTNMAAIVSAPINDSSEKTDPSSIESNSSEDKDTITNTSDNGGGSSRKIIDPDFHFFSDTELTSSPDFHHSDAMVLVESVLSDSEFEVKNRKGEDSKDQGQSWEWGGFPSVSQANSPTSDATTSPNDRSSVISSMFSFMKKSHGQSSEGMYLSDLNSEDPKVAALYFSGTKERTNADIDMDCESGNGPSLEQSPNSAEGCKSIDSDFEEMKREISLSLCGWSAQPDPARFEEHAVNFSDFCTNPTLLDSPDLVVAIKGKYYNWKVAAPIISSLMVFNRPLLQSTIDQLCNIHMPTKDVQDKKETGGGGASAVAGSRWWSWGRQKSSRESTPLDISAKSDDDVKEAAIVDLVGREEVVMEESQQQSSDYAVNLSDQNSLPVDKYRKTLRLSSKQIAQLNLRNGMNEVSFSVTTAYQGTSRCTCQLYKWKWDDKIVISDIDGTITKSDVLGHILPIVGKDWAQSGVAQLFNKINDNGYKLLYLSARAIGQARITREYLKSIKQGDLTMPDGPILLNPTSLIRAFHREVIEKKPELFKISCLSDIKALFPLDSNPFYAGYGNRINDVWAYRAVGIPIVRIFTINPKGELKHELTQTFQSTYLNMMHFVDQLFPTLIEAANDYSQFSYWRDPLPGMDELPEIA